MAELPHLGEHCSLPICNRLDFTPFRCDLCSKTFCGDHRLNHGTCGKAALLATTTGSESEPIRKFLCSFTGCFNKELFGFRCSRCQWNFCMAHRLCEGHQCKGLILKEEPAAPSPSNTTITSPPPTTTAKVKELNAVQQARADKIALMKARADLRLKNPLKIPSDDQLFLMVSLLKGDAEATEVDRRKVMMVSRQWTIGKAIDVMLKQLNYDGGAKLRLLLKGDPNVELPLGDPVSKHLNNESEVIIEWSRS